MAGFDNDWRCKHDNSKGCPAGGCDESCAREAGWQGKLSSASQSTLGREHIDYTALSGSALLHALGDDAGKWAAAFVQHAAKLGHTSIDEGWMIGWFANAIEHSSDVRRWRIIRARNT